MQGRPGLSFQPPSRAPERWRKWSAADSDAESSVGLVARWFALGQMPGHGTCNALCNACPSRLRRVSASIASRHAIDAEGYREISARTLKSTSNQLQPKVRVVADAPNSISCDGRRMGRTSLGLASGVRELRVGVRASRDCQTWSFRVVTVTVRLTQTNPIRTNLKYTVVNPLIVNLNPSVSRQNLRPASSGGDASGPAAARPSRDRTRRGSTASGGASPVSRSHADNTRLMSASTSAYLGSPARLTSSCGVGVQVVKLLGGPGAHEARTAGPGSASRRPAAVASPGRSGSAPHPPGASGDWRVSSFLMYLNRSDRAARPWAA